MWEAAARRDAVLPRARRFLPQFLLPQAVRRRACPFPCRPVPGPKKACQHCEREARARPGFSTLRRRAVISRTGFQVSRARCGREARALVQAYEFWIAPMLLRRCLQGLFVWLQEVRAEFSLKLYRAPLLLRRTSCSRAVPGGGLYASLASRFPCQRKSGPREEDRSRE